MQRRGDPQKLIAASWPCGEELYKLLMRRAPLKVAISYDWAVFAQEGNQDRQEWLSDKLRDLFRIGRTVTAYWPEAENTEYLLLVGRAEQEGGPHRWRYPCVQGGCWPEQPDELQAFIGLPCARQPG